MTTSTRPNRPAVSGTGVVRPASSSPVDRLASARAWLRSRHLPGRPSWWWPWGAVGVVVAVMAASVWLVWFSPAFAVRTVEVMGEQQVTDHEVLAAAAVPVGTPLLRLDVGAVAGRVEQLDAVAEAHVTRVWPDGVRIEVVERRPFAVIRTAAGYGVLGSDGVVFRSVPGPQPDLPFLDQQVGEAATDPGAAAALQVALDLPPAMSRRVASVTARSADTVLVTLRTGATVAWGTALGTPRKAEVLALLLPRHAAHYDVSAPDSPATRG